MVCTLASLWCGLSGNVQTLIEARVLQGFGATTLVGPILGGVLVDGLGWEWIFFNNVPVGIVGFILALRFVPSLSTHPHKFDIPGVLLSWAQSIMLPAAVIVLGAAVALFFAKPKPVENWGGPNLPASEASPAKSQ